MPLRAFFSHRNPPPEEEFYVKREQLPNNIPNNYKFCSRAEETFWLHGMRYLKEAHQDLISMGTNREEKGQYEILYLALMKTILEYKHEDPKIAHHFLWPYLRPRDMIDISSMVRERMNLKGSKPVIKFFEHDREEMRLFDLFKARLSNSGLGYQVEKSRGCLESRLQRSGSEATHTTNRDSDTFSMAPTLRVDSDNFSTAETLRY